MSSEDDRLEIPRQRVADAFANHWRGLLQSGEDISFDRSHCFFAGSPSAQAGMAVRFYGHEHVQKMASLTDIQIHETLSPWLENALRYWLDSCDDDDGDDFLDRVATSEYVSIFHPHGRGSMRLGRYPDDRAEYDDLYERTLAGVSVGGVLRIYKSTGEQFTPSEMKSVRAGIRKDLLSGIADAGDDEPWAISMDANCGWGTEGFENEDYERVVITEINDHDDP